MAKAASIGFFLAAIAFAIWVFGADAQDERLPLLGKHEDQIEKLTNPAFADQETRTLVERAVQVRGEFIVIPRPHIGTTEVHLIPASTPWAVRCDASGIVIAFGPDPTLDSGGLLALVADVKPHAEVCAPIVLRVAQVLRTMLSKAEAGRSERPPI